MEKYKSFCIIICSYFFTQIMIIRLLSKILLDCTLPCCIMLQKIVMAFHLTLLSLKLQFGL